MKSQKNLSPAGCVAIIVSGILLLLLFIPNVGYTTEIPTAPGATYYVSPEGNDRSSGSKDAPFRTIRRAAAVARPGDTVFVRKGTYPGIHLKGVTGAPDAWITFKAYPGEVVVIDAYQQRHAETIYGIAVETSSYIEINGFKVTDSDPLADSPSFADYSRTQHRGGIYVASKRYPPNHIRLIDNEIYHTGGNGIYTDYRSDHFVIQGNRIHQTGLSKRGYGIYLGGNYHVVKGNTIHHAYGHGIQVYTEGGPSLNYNIIEENVCHDNGHDDYGAGYISDGFPAEGRRVGNGIIVSTGRRSTSTGNIIRNNTVFNNINYGIEIKHSHDASCLNNTAYGNGYQGLYIADAINAVVRNNVCRESRNEDGSSGDAYVGRDNIEDHNLFRSPPR